MHKRHRVAATVTGMLLALAAGLSPNRASAQTIIDSWASTPLPPAPALKAATVDPKITALLVLDLMKQNCAPRPNCVASLTVVKKLLSEARAAKAAVVYSIFPGATTADILADVAPLPDEPWVQSGPDKFVNTDLAKILKDKGIQSVIVTGTGSNGAVLFTGAGAALRGMNVIVPVDGMSAAEPFADLSTAYTFAKAPLVAAKTTLTKADMIKF